MVGENEVRVLEVFLQELALDRKKSVAKPMTDNLAPGVGAGHELYRRAPRFADPHRILAGEYYPFHLELGMDLGQVQDRTASPDFNVVTVGAEAKQTVYTSQIRGKPAFRPSMPSSAPSR